MHSLSKLSVLALFAAAPAATAQQPSFAWFFNTVPQPAGSNGTLSIGLTGQPVLGTTMTLGVAQAPASSACSLAVGGTATTQDFLGATLLVEPSGASFFNGTSDAAGSWSVPLSLPNDPALAGLDLFGQFYSSEAGTFLASGGAHMRLGTTAGAPGFADMVYQDTLVPLDAWADLIPLGTCTLNGTVDMSATGEAIGVVTVDLPNGTVCNVLFQQGDGVVVFVGAGFENVLDLHVGSPDLILDGVTTSIDDLFTTMDADITAGSWSPLTEGFLAILGVVHSQAFGENAQTALLASSPAPASVPAGGRFSRELGYTAQLTSPDAGLCEMTVDSLTTMVGAGAAKGCGALVADCKARKGCYFDGWIKIECEWLEWVCAGAAGFAISYLRDLMFRLWSQE